METGERETRRVAKVAEEAAAYSVRNSADAARVIKKLEQQMQKHARDLEFEEAARLRDEIAKLKKIEFGLTA